MPNKSFSIYSGEDFAVEDGDRLVLEIAKSHLACILTRDGNKAIAACELFSFTEDEGKNLDEVFTKAAVESKILTDPSLPVSVHINTEHCIPVPIFKFNKEIAAEYSNIVFGEDASSKIQFEHLPVEPGIMNVYRVNAAWFESLQQRFSKVSFHHSYSNIIRRVGNTGSAASELITIQFYNTFMIVVVMKEGSLHLIQTFVYETPDDVLYYLLNIAKQFELYSERLTIQISGMVDPDFQLYRELITYFKIVNVEKVNESNLLLNAGEHPLHYFTPFFNLAL